jgi:hypothetical protein
MSLSDELRGLDPEAMLESYGTAFDAMKADPSEHSPVLDALGDYPALLQAVFGFEELLQEKTDYTEDMRTLVFQGIFIALGGLARYAHEEVARQHVQDIPPPQG